MEVNTSGMPKKGLRYLDEIDRLINYWKKAKSESPEQISIASDVYDYLLEHSQRAWKFIPGSDRMERRQVRLNRHVVSR